MPSSVSGDPNTTPFSKKKKKKDTIGGDYIFYK